MYRNYHSFRKHLWRAHKEDLSVGPESADPDPVDNSVNVDEVEFPCRNSEESIVDSKRSAALFVLKTQEIHKVSQIALDDLIAEFSFICSSELNLLQTKVFKCLGQAEVNLLEVEGLRSIFSTCTLRDPFCGLTTPYLRDSYIQKHFGLVVSLFSVKVFLNIVCNGAGCSQNFL